MGPVPRGLKAFIGMVRGPKRVRTLSGPTLSAKVLEMVAGVVGDRESETS